MILHADGKKHRAKARAFHAAQKQTNQTEESVPCENKASNLASLEANGSDNKVQGDIQIDSNASIREGEKESKTKKKRKLDASGDCLSKKGDEKNVYDLTNGEVIEAEDSERPHRKSKKKNCSNELLHNGDGGEKHDIIEEPSESKIKWKKLVTSTLKSNPDGVMKIKKLQKVIIKALRESGVTEDEGQLEEKLMQKINSSSRVNINNKHICLVAKTQES